MTVPDFVLERRAEQERVAWQREARVPHPDVDLVEVGSFLIRGTPPLTDEERDFTELSALDDEVNGGTCWRIVTDVDMETGEVRRGFLTVSTQRGQVRFGRLRGDQVAKVELPNGSLIRSAVRLMARTLGDRKRRGAFTSDDVRLVEAIDALIRVVA